MEFNTIIEPFKIKSVEPIKMTTPDERKVYLEKAKYNPFKLESDQVMIDFLTDSGTSAMSANQWAGIMIGDESYAGSKSWEHMHSTIKDLTGYHHILPTHQGRAAERILYSVLGGKGKVFISNTHFDTTRANIEYTGATAFDIPIPEATHPKDYHPFKGNMDISKLEELIVKHGPENIGCVILTVTNNSGGGQPVSMQNTKDIHSVCRKFGVKFILDCCRIAENAYFIKHREKEYENKTYKEIAQEMFSLADGAVMSAKKDALVNMGGFLAIEDEKLSEKCSSLLIITEGFTTYGGLSGRDMEAIAIGLKEIFEPDYLLYRIKSTAYLGEHLDKMGIPLMLPIGGHAVYIDAKELYPHIPVDQYPGQALVCELYLTGGVRAVEIGSVMFGKYDKDGKLIPAQMELVRLAIPRRVYTQSHIEYVIEVFSKIIENKKNVRGYEIVYETEYLRHFTAEFRKL
ncbi:MAG: tryptophanase [Ignavibacteria bacterium]|nr:tryptophanase [Ignavibacteria bacterium]